MPNHNIITILDNNSQVLGSRVITAVAKFHLTTKHANKSQCARTMQHHIIYYICRNTDHGYTSRVVTPEIFHIPTVIDA